MKPPLSPRPSPDHSMGAIEISRAAIAPARKLLAETLPLVRPERSERFQAAVDRDARLRRTKPRRDVR